MPAIHRRFRFFIGPNGGVHYEVAYFLLPAFCSDQTSIIGPNGGVHYEVAYFLLPAFCSDQTSFQMVKQTGCRQVN